MTSSQNRFRAIPSVDRVMSSPTLSALDEVPRSALVESVRIEIESLRKALSEGQSAVVDVESIAGRSLKRAQSAVGFRPAKVINATGVVLHTNLGRAPLASAAIEALREAAAYCDLEYDVAEGRRGDRHAHVEGLLCSLTGAEAAVVVNNNASAVLLVLSALAMGKEVVVSRGELVEIGGSFRIPDILHQSGARLVEVGTTNRTRIGDYERGVSAETAMLLKVHPSNYRVVGFTEDVDCAALLPLAKAYGLTVYYDAGSGLLVDLEPYGLRAEPTIQSLVATGCDLISFSGDKLLGGPQAGLIVGKASLVEAIRRHPMYRALRLDKATLGALSATLRIYAYGEPLKEIPTLRMLCTPEEELLSRARRLASNVASALPGAAVDVIMAESTPGGGSYPTETMISPAVRIAVNAVGPHTMASLLRQHKPAVVGRVSDGALVLDPRTLDQNDEPSVIAALKRAMAASDTH